MEWVSIFISFVALGLSYVAFQNSKKDRLQDLRMQVRSAIDTASELLKSLPEKILDLGSGTENLLSAMGQYHSGHREKEEQDRSDLLVAPVN